jgi:uncharacterized protein with HEPN domain
VSSKPSPKERHQNYCDDAIEAIDAIATYVDGLDFSSYSGDRRTTSAVEREMLIISEVISRLDGFADHYPDAYHVRGLGNRLRHEYQHIDNSIVWSVISGKQLKILRAAFVTYRSKL